MFPSFTLNAIDFARTFGLGIAVLLFYCLRLMKENEDYKIIERENSANLLQITKENIATMAAITQLVEAIAPAISTSSQESRRQIDIAITNFKEHVSHQTEVLKIAIESRNKS